MPEEPPAANDGQATVQEYLEGWLWGKQALSPSTHAAYEIHIRRYLAPHLGELRLEALRPIHIEKMYRALCVGEAQNGQGLEVSTRRRIHATLMSAMNTAVRRGLIERNPAVTVELPRQPRISMKAWTSEELKSFLGQIEDQPLHLLFLLLGISGLRRGEAVALRWCDVDLNRALLHVEQSTVRVGARIITGTPKSTSGRRTVTLDERTTRRLAWHQCRQRLAVLRSTGHQDAPELVFTTPEGHGLDPAYVSRLFDRLVTLHGVRPIRLHDLRHTSASIGLTSGESLVEVSRRLGHSSIAITADVYSHISPEVARGSAERRARSLYPD